MLSSAVCGTGVAAIQAAAQRLDKQNYTATNGISTHPDDMNSLEEGSDKGTRADAPSAPLGPSSTGRPPPSPRGGVEDGGMGGSYAHIAPRSAGSVMGSGGGDRRGGGTEVHATPEVLYRNMKQCVVY